jgi:hypothetical protein
MGGIGFTGVQNSRNPGKIVTFFRFLTPTRVFLFTHHAADFAFSQLHTTFVSLPNYVLLLGSGTCVFSTSLSTVFLSIVSMPSTESTDDAPPRKDVTMSEPGERRGADKSIANIYEQNQIWKNKKLAEDKDFFKTLGSTHKPDYMWIGM